MDTKKQPFYIGYHHLTIACFIFVLIQIIFLVCIQSIGRKSIADSFFEEGPYILYKLKSELALLNYHVNKQQLIKELHSNISPNMQAYTKNISIHSSWELKNIHDSGIDQKINQKDDTPLKSLVLQQNLWVEINEKLAVSSAVSLNSDIS